MARVVLVELAPWKSSTGEVVTLRLAGGGRRHYTHRGSTDWLGGVVTLPKVTTELPFSGTDFTGGAIPKAAAVGFNPSRPGTRDTIATLMMIGAPVTVRVDDDEAAKPTWPVTLAGTVADCSTSGGMLTITLSDLTGNLGKPLVTATFAGTGGLEGPAEAAGRVKRRSWGRCWNVEGFVLDKGNNVYEFGDPAFPLFAIDVVKDRGRAGALHQLAWQGSAAATLAALAAADVPDGGAVVAPSIACAKWWTTPSAPLTADLRGEVGGGYVESVPAIAARIVVAANGPAISDLDAVIASRPDEAGCHVDNTNDTAATVLNELLLKASLAWSIEASGEMTLAPIAFGAPVATLVASDVARQQSYPPVTSIEVGFRKNHRQHTDAEISAAVLSDVIQLTGDSPIETAIGDAGKTATEVVAPGAAIGGTKNPDGTITGGLPAKVAVDALAILAGTDDAETIIARANAAIARAQSALASLLSAQLLGEARKARTERLMHLDGQQLNTRVVQEITERKEGDTAIVERVDLIEATASDGIAAALAAISDEASVRASADEAETAQREDAISSVLANIDGERVLREAEIERVETTSASNLSAATSQLEAAISTVEVAIDDERLQRQAAIVSERTTSADALNAATSQLEAAISTVEIAIGDERLQRKAEIERVETTSASNLSAATSQFEAAISTVEVAIDDERLQRQAAIVSERTTSADALNAATSQLEAAISTVEIAIGDERLQREAAITDERHTSANALSAATSQLESAISAVELLVDGERQDRQAAITQERNTSANEAGAIASQVLDLGTEVGEHQASIMFLLETTNGEHAVAQLSLNVNGQISGFKINGEDRLFVVAADRFVVGNSQIFEIDTTTGETVVNRVKANSIDTAQLKVGAVTDSIRSISATTFNGQGSTWIEVSRITVSSQYNMTIDILGNGGQDYGGGLSWGLRILVDGVAVKTFPYISRSGKLDILTIYRSGIQLTGGVAHTITLEWAANDITLSAVDFSILLRFA